MPDFTGSFQQVVITDRANVAVPNKSGVTVSGALTVNEEGYKATYRTGGVANTLFSTSAAVLIELVGSATKTIRIKKIKIWAQAATKFYAELTLLRCTGASAGTPAVVVPVPMDTTDPAATAVLNLYTAAAAFGAGHLVIGSGVLTTSPPTAGLGALACIWDFCINQDKPIILRGVGDVLEVYNNTTGLGAGTFGYEIEWEEDAS